MTSDKCFHSGKVFVRVTINLLRQRSDLEMYGLFRASYHDGAMKENSF